MYAAKIANEMIGVRTDVVFANARGIEPGRVVRRAREIKRGSPSRHTIWG
jgi:hypothetical protein